MAERRNIRRNDYNPGYYGGYSAYEYDNYDYGYYNNGYSGYDDYSGDYYDYQYRNEYAVRPEEKRRKPAQKKTVKSSGKKSGAKKQPQKKKAPVRNGSQGSAAKKRRPQGMGMDYGYSRYPEQEIRYRREPAGDYYNSSMSYAGRGQMSYDDFVRNREFFGGEDEVYTVHHQHRRTGGTVKNKPQQGRNNTTDEKNNKKKRTAGNETGGQIKRASSETKKKTVNRGNKPEEKAKNQKRSKEIMDERARRRKIRRHAGRASKTMTPRKRKIKRFFTAFSIFLVIAIISVMLSLTVFFKTEKIIVTGETRYSQEDIINLSGIVTGENIFLCDKAAASKKIVDALPFVAQANVGFVIPNAITIEIVEDVPSYAIGYSDGYYIIGENGRILEKTAENYDNLPIVQGTEITTNIIGEYADFTDENITSILNELVKVLDAYKFENVTVIDISDTANIMFVYDNRITVVIGLPEDISYKVKTAQTIINEKLDPNNTGLIKGRLDVSMCNDTKKSYFNENEVYVPQVQQPAVSPTEETAPAEETQEVTEEVTQEETLEAAAEETLEAEATEETQETAVTEAPTDSTQEETVIEETDAPA